MVWFDPTKTSYEALLGVFWENHDPTQGMRQGNDVGTQYRSGIYAFSADQKEKAEASRAVFQRELAKNRMSAITTEILDAPAFYYAEDYHQQYLAKNPGGYCGLAAPASAARSGSGFRPPSSLAGPRASRPAHGWERATPVALMCCSKEKMRAWRPAVRQD
jgi:peptide-methionine (S)-S-oxide reductase